MEKEGSYKIISIKKKHPIFICKAIPTKSPPVLDPLPPPVHQSPQFTLLKHQLQKATEHIQPLKTPKIQQLARRSNSCELSYKGKHILSARELEPKQKQLRNIRQYLRFAYKRSEREKRSTSHRLPELTVKEQQRDTYMRVQGERQTHYDADVKHITSMKQVLRKAKSKNQRVVNVNKQHEEENIFNGGISGWEEFGNPEDF